MICPTCRAQLPDGTQFCGGCGSRFGAEQPFPKTQASAAVQAASVTRPSQPGSAPQAIAATVATPVVQTPAHYRPATAPVVQPHALPGAGPMPMSAMAVAGFVCGLLGLVPYWIGFTLCILGIIFSSIGLSATGEGKGMRGRGLAIAGLVLSCVFFLPASCGL